MEERVKKFYEIRNIPYHISINGELGSDCEDKANMLASELKKTGCSSKRIVALFKWSDQGLPANLLAVPHEDDCSHMFLEVKNPQGQWVYVDSTWNPELAKAGFTISNWDGQKPTDLALKCNRILSAEDSEKYLQSIDYEEDLKINGKFYQAFNKFCDSFLDKVK